MKYTIIEFHAQYPDDSACLAEIFKNRYGSLKVCPDCKKDTKFYRVSKRKCYACQYCGHQLHPLAGTIFHKSGTSLYKWFFAIFLFANSKNGVSGKELERQLGVTYKCAWRMAKQIRLLFSKSGGKLSKIVEVDETYVGGRRKGRWEGKAGRGAAGKTAVFGMVEREGDIKAEVVQNVKASSLMPLIKENIEPGSRIMSDYYSSYNKVRNMGFYHRRINHAIKQYVRGKTHTNTIEGFWSQMKRSIDGTYHSVSPKYLQHYVDEFSYRYNLRNDEPSSFFPSMVGEVVKQVL